MGDAEAEGVFPCPICAKPVPRHTHTCAQCEIDLTAVALADGLPHTYYNRGIVLARQGRTAEAVEALSVAVALEPSHVNSRVALGKLLAQAGRTKAARQQLRAAADLDPDHGGAQRALAALDRQTVRRRVFLTGAVAALAVSLALGLGLGLTIPDGDTGVEGTRPLLTEVRDALSSSPGLTGVTIEAEVDGDAIVLSGEVTDPLQRELAVALATQAAEGAAVDASRLGVSEPPENDLVAAAEAALGADPITSELSLSLSQRGSGLLVQGTAPNPTAAARVVEILRDVEGVELVDASRLSVESEPATYVVRRGDTLWGIAELLLGDGDLWPVLHEANRSQVPSPELLQVGQVLSIPP